MQSSGTLEASTSSGSSTWTDSVLIQRRRLRFARCCVLAAFILWCPMTALCGDVTLQWDTVPGASGYRLYQAVGTSGFSPISDHTALTATVAGISMTQITMWRVTAIGPNGVEGPPSNTVTNIPVPTGITLNDLGRHRRDLGWSSDLTASTVIERAIESDSFQQVAVLAPGLQHWSDNRARQKVTRYRLKSCRAGLCSAWSEIVWRP